MALRKAKVEDIKKIHSLINSYALISQSFIYVVFLYSFSIFLPLYSAVAQQSDSPAPAFFTNEVSILKKQIATHEQNETEAFQALEQARKALDLAIKKSDTAAQDIAKQAIALTEEALSTVQRQKVRDEARLRALEDALKWKDAGRGFGITGIIKGEVLKKSKAGSASFDGKSPLLEGDTIETGKDGFVEIILPDYSFVSVGDDTAMEVLKLDSDKMQSTYNILKGKLYILRACLKYALKDRGLCWGTNYRVPNVDIAVRGTEFAVEYSRLSKETLAAVYDEGRLAVTQTDESGKDNQEYALEKNTEIVFGPSVRRFRSVPLARMSRYRGNVTSLRTRLAGLKSWKPRSQERRAALRDRALKRNVVRRELNDSKAAPKVGPKASRAAKARARAKAKAAAAKRAAARQAEAYEEPEEE